MPRKRHQTAVEIERRTQEALNKTVNVRGVGEDPSVRAFIEKMATASPMEALEISQALQRHIQGLADEDIPEKKERLLVLKARGAEADAAEKAWNDDKVAFVQKIFDDNPPATGKVAERIKARAAKKFQQAAIHQRASIAEKKLRLDYEIANGRRETILVTGHFENLDGRVLLMPDVLKIMHRTFVLKPGQQDVPRVVADAYRSLMATRAERQARSDAMSASDGAGPELSEFNKRQRRLDKEYTNSEFSGGGIA